MIDRSITLSLSITCGASSGANQGWPTGLDGSHYLINFLGPRLRTVLCLLSAALRDVPSLPQGHSPPIHSYSPGM
jgi:hypothetical protein